MAPAIMPNHDTQVMLMNLHYRVISYIIKLTMRTAIPHHMPSCKTKLDASNRFMQDFIFMWLLRFCLKPQLPTFIIKYDY